MKSMNTKAMTVMVNEYMENSFITANTGTAARMLKPSLVVTDMTSCMGTDTTFRCNCPKNHDSSFTNFSPVGPSAWQPWTAKGPSYGSLSIRLADAMMNIGRGGTDAFTLCGFMNIPTASLRAVQASFKRAEAVLFSVTEPIVRDSYDKICAEMHERAPSEMECLEPADNPATGKQYTPVVVAVDAGWAKRGSGHSYTSNVGVTTFIDVAGDCQVCDYDSIRKNAMMPNSGVTTFIDVAGNSKVCDFEIKQKSCRKCEFFRTRYKKQHPECTSTDFDNALQEHKEEHDCRENHRGQSSGSMEAVSCVVSSHV